MPNEINELPLPDGNNSGQTSQSEAVNYVREKLSNFYPDEPNVQDEAQEITMLGAKSDHQVFINNLLNSGKNLAQIQTEWHLYYQDLSDEQKHTIWQEYYDNHAEITKQKNTSQHRNNGVSRKSLSEHQSQAYYTEIQEAPKKHSISGKGILKKRHRLQSLFFGLGFGALIIFIFLFGFFNERFIAPFISPSKNVALAPLILDPTGNNNVGPENILIVPKINVVAPVIYDVPSISPNDMLLALNNGVVHYPQSSLPGQNGNVVIVGHSSNNYFNDGKYKFAFVLLDQLDVGDTFMINYNSKQYVYQVYSRKIVDPTDIAVLGTADRPSTATLITCNPVGTSLHRLVLLANQISPAPASNSPAPSSPTSSLQPTIIPGNSESLWQRFIHWLTS
jgi:LPXTG-site transpeptidase (sortase) family protein